MSQLVQVAMLWYGYTGGMHPYQHTTGPAHIWGRWKGMQIRRRGEGAWLAVHVVSYLSRGTSVYYEGGLRFSSISPCKEPGGGRRPPPPRSGVVQEEGGRREGSSRGGPGWPRPEGSYWEFSRRDISRSSSSPNSPPIKEGSPTTITSWNGCHHCICLEYYIDKKTVYIQIVVDRTSTSDTLHHR